MTTKATAERVYEAKRAVVKIEKKLRKIAPRTEVARRCRLNKAWRRADRACVRWAVMALRYGVDKPTLRKAVADALA